ncbi:ATP-binding protein [Tundrisphaera sp. TA3]|uniref:ATP-binding protein n=1 Tax=Tundrisphaera sp. TA3 TaxID=3435775 RepID=UPI003EB8B728
MTATPILTVEVRDERGVVQARQGARQVAARFGFESQDQVRIATAISEVARNAVQHAGGGRVELLAEGDPARALMARVIDSGPGLDESKLGAGGLSGARRLMDGLRIESAPGQGTTIILTKALPRRSPGVTARDAARIAGELAPDRAADPFEELRRQNRELLRVLDDLRAREVELSLLNSELEETNRGVLALHKELDERAESLKKAGELKTRFLANVSHEFRTPLTSILSIGRLLIDRTDGDLSTEQERQVSFILRAAHDLTGLVNDLLDLARIEAGRETVWAEPFRIEDMFGALRGMLRPLIPAGAPVELIFEPADGLPILHTDEAKLAQILRNFLSNALKFTDAGEVRVRADQPEPGRVRFRVSDTGIGIAPEFHAQIFEEFAQVDSPIQRRVKGTGLGLPLTRKLAGLLGGTVGVESRPGVGSTFWATVPIAIESSGEAGPAPLPSRAEP